MSYPRYAFAALCCLLASCSAEQDTTGEPLPAAAEMPAAAATVTLPAAPEAMTAVYDTGHSIRTLMNTMVQPNATTVWQAVRYVVNEDGVQEDVQPETDEDWERLRHSAVTLVEAGNALMLPGRVVDDTPLAPEYPAFQYTPDEIQALLEADMEGWNYYLQEMQFATNATLEAIDSRDLLGLIDKGATINNACQGCHAEFWYRRNNP